MKNLTPEMIKKAKTARSAAELFELAKANNVELTEETAKTYFEQFHANAAISDEELEAVSGGALCHDKEKESEESLPTGSHLEDRNGGSSGKFG